jgi:hypothetical protein
MIFDFQSVKSTLRNFLIWNRKTEFIFEDLHRPVGDIDPLDAAQIICELIKEGLLEQFVRLTIDGVNHDFPSIIEIPDVIDGKTITPDDFRVMYRKVPLITPFEEI